MPQIWIKILTFSNKIIYAFIDMSHPFRLFCASRSIDSKRLARTNYLPAISQTCSSKTMYFHSIYISISINHLITAAIIKLDIYILFSFIYSYLCIFYLQFHNSTLYTYIYNVFLHIQTLVLHIFEHMGQIAKLIEPLFWNFPLVQNLQLQDIHDSIHTAIMAV